MTFPVYLNFFGSRIHPHLVFEIIAYSAGFQLYLFLRKRSSSALPIETNMRLVAACLLGALLGSKLLAWLEAPLEFWSHINEFAGWEGGKTIVGGLLGGWAGIEWIKRRLNVTRSTGDLFVFPLILGMSLGRIGCFLTGLDDHTHGIATTLPWGVDFGDGIPRHPTQLYDIAFLAALALVLKLCVQPNEKGCGFRWFMLSYLGWRLAVEFLKPRHTHWGLSAIQFACAGGIVVTLLSLRKMARNIGQTQIAAVQ